MPRIQGLVLAIECVRMSDAMNPPLWPSFDSAVFLVDRDRGSYVRAADLYVSAFRAAGIEVESRDYGTRPADSLRGRWVVHHTIGPLFRRVEGAFNTAVVFHEWSRYPGPWLETLNRFETLWAPSRHVSDVLLSSGATTKVRYVPPPVALENSDGKQSWHAKAPFRFLSVGEPHFRKGFHLLIAGYLAAFPEEGEAELTLKVSSSCDWQSPRADIRFLRDRLSRSELDALFTSHDAYVTASLGEGLGLPLAEAILALLPAAANWWGGHRDIVRRDDFWEIAHDELPQAFCSQPSFYAAGQQCAYSSPDHIAAVLRAVVGAEPAERERRARRARAAVHETHGLQRVAAYVREHVPSGQGRDGL
jgi:glycosyltransferase involved in cell wall biosynthesis